MVQQAQINRFLRISIGTDEEMDRVLEVIRELVK
jgi:histidinol-phosphate/aromatic aminotransferase/cobyric acid decarboxylase-like protein